MSGLCRETLGLQGNTIGASQRLTALPNCRSGSNRSGLADNRFVPSMFEMGGMPTLRAAWIERRALPIADGSVRDERSEMQSLKAQRRRVGGDGSSRTNAHGEADYLLHAKPRLS